jgi:hypothetical protein
MKKKTVIINGTRVTGDADFIKRYRAARRKNKKRFSYFNF